MIPQLGRPLSKEELLEIKNKYLARWDSATKDQQIQWIQETEELIRQNKILVYGNDFYKFNKEVLQWPDIYEPLHKKVCDFIQENIWKKKILLLLPRGTFKSSIVTVGGTTWLIGSEPQVRVLLANGTRDMAVSFLGQVKDQLRKNEKFKKIYGDLALNAETWREDKLSIGSEKSYEAKDPTVQATGIGTNVVGSHFDIAILDDPVTRENSGTKEQIEKVIQFYKDTLDLIDPLPNGHKPMIIIGTTWHEADLYAWIQDPETGIGEEFAVMKLPAYEGDWEKGELLFPTRLTWEALKSLKRNQGPSHFCTPGESPVLMGDLTTKRIEDVKAGDYVVGWNDGQRPRCSLTRSKVKKVFSYEAEVVEMKMESGRTVRCTPEHRWFTGRGYGDKCHPRYKPAKVGSKLQFILDPTIPTLNEHQRDLANWLGGMFDGEGTCTQSIVFSQDLVHNPLVCKALEKALTKVGFSWTNYQKEYPHKPLRERRKNMYWVTGGKEAKKNFVNLCHPIKKGNIIDSFFRAGSNFIQSEDRVLEINKIGKMPVYALETETGNYVVWGYGSSNSAQYLLDPVPLENATFKQKFKYYDDTDVEGLFLNKFIAVDPALSESKEADYSAMICVGVDHDNVWYILDIWRDKVNPQRLLDQIFKWHKKWQPITVAIESGSFQKTLRFYAGEEMKKRNYNLYITELVHNDRSKRERILGLEPRYENGDILHNKYVPFIKDLEEELRRFPRSKHDDISDALASILEVAYPPKKKTKKDEWGESTSRKGSNYPA